MLLKFQVPPSVVSWLPVCAGFGMTLFFVISGFVIHYNYRRRVTEQGLNGLGEFIWARFARLYPLFLFVLAIDFLFGRPLMLAMVGNADTFREVFKSLPFYLLLVQSWLYVPFSENSLIYVFGGNVSLTWSISTEWFFYLAYPIVAFFVLRARRPAVVLGAILAWSMMWMVLASTLSGHAQAIDRWGVGHFGQLAGLAAGTQDSFFRWLLYFSPYLRIGEFILGCLVAQLYLMLRPQKVSEGERTVGWFLSIVGAASVPLALFLTYSSDHGWAFLGRLSLNFALAPSVALIIFCAARYENSISRILGDRRLVALGEASYSIYLVHFLIFLLISNHLGQVLPVTLPNVIFFSVRFLFALAIVILIALGLHSFLEVPARSWLRGLWHGGVGSKRRLAPLLLMSPVIVALPLFLMANSPPIATKPVLSGIRVTSATYGPNCGAKTGNVNRVLREACNGREICDYRIDVGALGDPASGCAKNFVIEFECVPNDTRFTKEVAAEAGLGSQLRLSCPRQTSR